MVTIKSITKMATIIFRAPVTASDFLGLYGETFVVEIEETFKPRKEKSTGIDVFKPQTQYTVPVPPRPLSEARFYELVSTPLYLEPRLTHRALKKVGGVRHSVRTHHRDFLLSREIDDLEIQELYQTESRILRDFFSRDLLLYSLARRRFESETIPEPEPVPRKTKNGYWRVPHTKPDLVDREDEMEWDDVEFTPSPMDWSNCDSPASMEIDEDSAPNNTRDETFEPMDTQFQANWDLFGLKAVGQGLESVGNGISNSVADITALLQGPLDQMTKLIQALTPSFSPTSFIQVITTLVLLWRNRSSVVNMGLILTNYFATTGIANAVAFFQPVMDLISTQFQSGEEAIFNEVEKFRETLIAWFPAGCTVVVCMLLPLLGKSVPTSLVGIMDYFRTTCLKDLAAFFRNITFISSGYALLRSIASSVVNYFMHLVLDTPHPEILTNIDVLTKFYERFDELSKTESIQRCIVENSVVLEIEKLQTDILEWRKTQKTLTQEEISVFTTLLNKVCALQTRMCALSSKQAWERVPPLGVLISGKSGIGKSTMTDYIIRSLVKYHNKLVNEGIVEGRLYADTDLTELKYPLNVDSDFWDGYKNQFAIYVDDFGQRADSAANPNRQFSETINVVNSATYSLNSAHLEEKGKKYCDSRFYLCTANKLYYQIKSLTHAEALYRRFKVVAECRVRNAYSQLDADGNPNGLLDMTKCNGLDLKAYEFDLYDERVIAENKGDIQPFVQNLSFQSFVDLLRKCYREGFEKDSRITRELKNDDNYTDDIQDPAATDALFNTHFQGNYETAVAAGLDVTPSECEFSDSDDEFLDVFPLTIREELTERILDARAENALRREKVMKIGKTLLAIAGIVISVYAGNALYKWITQKDTGCSNCNTWRDSKKDQRALSLYIKNAKSSCSTCTSTLTKCLNNMDVKEEGALDEKGFNIISLVQKQQATIHLDKDSKRVGVATFIKGRICLMNRHIEEALKTKECFYLRYLGFADPMKVLVKDCSWLEPEDLLTTDYALCICPTNVPHKKDIVSHFVSSVELNHFKETRACLTGLTFTVKTGNGFSRMGDAKALDSTVINGRTLRELYQYSMNTEKGDCGALLIAQNPKINNKILGIHTFGSACYNGSASITREKLERLLASAKSEYQISLPEMDSVIETNTVLSHMGEPIPNLTSYGKLKNAPPLATKTQLVRSPLHDKLSEPSTCLPAVLYNPSNNPLTMGLKKVANVPEPLDSEQLKRCSDHVFQKLTKLGSEYKTKGVLSYEEGIKGDGNLIVPLSRTTSAGYPFVNQKGATKGKQKWFGSSDYIIDEGIRSLINERVAKAKQGIRSETVWIDTLKDERRPKEKVLANKTRVFSVGPMDFIIALRMYFGAFTGAVMENRIDNEICVGVNPYPDSPEWQLMYLRLLRNGHTKMIAGDFSNFDGSLLLDVLMEIVDRINQWYDDGEENALVRKVLWHEICQGMHSAEGQVYFWTHSQPSGNSMTVIINSIFNSIIMRMSFLLATKRSLMDYDRYVTALNYGDDNLLSFDDVISEEFNQVTITEALAKIGLTYTDEAKTGQLTKYRTIDDVAFLKRGFRVQGSDVYAPLSLTTIKEMVQWLRSSADVVNDTAAHVELALTELSLHDKETFDKVSTEIIKACTENGIPVTGYSYFDMCRDRQFHKLFESGEIVVLPRIKNCEPSPCYFQGNTEDVAEGATTAQETQNSTSCEISSLSCCIELTNKTENEQAVASQEVGDILLEGNKNLDSDVSTSSSNEDETRYCCENHCMEEPFCQVDGIACRTCNKFNYCQCDCILVKRKLQAAHMEINAPVTISKMIKKKLIQCYITGKYNSYCHYDKDTGCLFLRKLHKAQYIVLKEEEVKQCLSDIINNFNFWLNDFSDDDDDFELNDYLAMNISGNPKVPKILAKKVYESAGLDPADCSWFFYMNKVHKALLTTEVITALNGFGYSKAPRVLIAYIAPLLEEVLPSDVFSKVFLGLYEFTAKLSNGAPLLSTLPALGVHLFNAFLMSFGRWLSLPARLIIHCYFNISVFLMMSKLAETPVVDEPVVEQAAHFQGDLEDNPLSENQNETMTDIAQGSNLTQTTEEGMSSTGTEQVTKQHDENITSFKHLSRQILVDSVTLDNSVKFTHKINPVSLLLAHPAIKPFVQLFKYIRSGVKVTAQVNATKVSQGTGYLFWTPAGYTDPATQSAATSCIGAYLSYNTGESASVEIPYVHWQKALEIGDTDNVDTFRLTSIVPYIGDSCTVNFYAEFVEPELFVPTLPASVTSVFQDMFKSFVSQFTDVNHSVMHEQDTSSYKSPLPSNHTSMEYLIKDKMLVGVYDWSTSDAVGTKLADIPVQPGSKSADNIDVLSTVCGLWRGSMDYFVNPNTHILQTGRVRVGLFPEGMDRSYDNLNAVPNYIIDLSQDQKHVKMESVWTVNDFWLTASKPCVYLTIFVANTLIDSQNETGSCPLMVTRSGSNLEFGYIYNGNVTPAVAYGFTNREDNLKVGKPLSLKDLIQTPVPRKTNSPCWNFALPVSGRYSTPFETVANMFSYCSGSVVARGYTESDACYINRYLGSSGTTNVDPGTFNGMAYRQDSNLNPVVNVVVPWVCNNNFAPIQKGGILTNVVQLNPIVAFAFTAGDDFAFGYKVGVAVVPSFELFHQSDMDAIAASFYTGTTTLGISDGTGDFIAPDQAQGRLGPYSGDATTMTVLNYTGGDKDAVPFKTNKTGVASGITGPDISMKGEDNNNVTFKFKSVTINNGTIDIQYTVPSTDNLVNGINYSVTVAPGVRENERSRSMKVKNSSTEPPRMPGRMYVEDKFIPHPTVPARTWQKQDD